MVVVVARARDSEAHLKLATKAALVDVVVAGQKRGVEGADEIWKKM